MGSPITGKGGRVYMGSVLVANIKDWSMSGFSQGTAEVTAFGDTVKKFVAADAGDPGTISFSGNYDPADSTGQQAIDALCVAGSSFTNLYLYANTATFYYVGPGGEIIVTKAKAVALARSGVGTVSFEGKVSGAAMLQAGTGS